MTSKPARILTTVLTLGAITFSLSMRLHAQTETTLYTFAKDANGYNPVASLTFDAAGNLYGTTSEGGNTGTKCSSPGCGVVFQLSPGSGGTWTETLLHTFTGGKDGANPFVGLTADSSGNFYGTTGNGGSTIGNPAGWGTIFKLSPNSTGGWTKTFVHTFTGGRDGADPYGNLILDSAGNIYGTAHTAGDPSCFCGLVFKLSPISGAGWKETVLHTFKGADGSHPSASLVFDSAGNLYGTTSFGGKGCTVGICGSGTAFELSPTSTGGWKETVLHYFINQADGGYPASSLVFDAAGNLYGTTTQGGNFSGSCFSGCGTVFELSPLSTGAWKETTLHQFTFSDGSQPQAGLVLAPNGNLYGTASQSTAGCGVVFQLSPASAGSWAEATTYNFTCFNDGASPQATLITDQAGNLYGTTSIGGANGAGVVFEITP
ncbi:MAG TPA: choice-of-anchor tandem repeat GloVer-containing protein [Candidatus Dormibacteraeota bacterium]|nr:choice-of-anchor tandem repeat GloVer-containing protein [Candidatus Dormibacteraeota bacterium]